MKDYRQEERIIQEYIVDSTKQVHDRKYNYTEVVDLMQLTVKKLSIFSVKHNNSHKYTGLYIVFMTALGGLLGGMGWYLFRIEVGIFTLLVLMVMFLAAIRYNQ